ncbi:MAG: helix-turn-helix transcriptional regulator [Planctomycetes bacterium]|nr:helix-turn-helix transcriptional regulator [Planctomycetota bacterium]
MTTSEGQEPIDAPTLSLDELSPRVSLSGYWRYDRDNDHRYRVPGYHFILIERGVIEATTHRGRFTAGTGDLICFGPADGNRYGNRGPTSFWQIHVLFAPGQRSRGIPWLDELGELPPVVRCGAAFAEIRAVFERLCRDLDQGGVAFRLRATGAIYDLLALIAGTLTGRTPTGAAIDIWQRARMRLSSDLSRDLAVADLAGEIGISADHFIRAFRGRFGVSPMRYRQQAKLRHAMRLLRDPGRSIKSIAHELGFVDDASFTRLFRRATGLTPTDLRIAPPVDDVPGDDARLYPVNRHVLPLSVPDDHFSQFAPRPE